MDIIHRNNVQSLILCLIHYFTLQGRYLSASVGNLAT
jgi:hypothetical protein